MKVLFYGGERAGMVVLLYLLAKGYEVVVVPVDSYVERIAKLFNLKILSFDDIAGEMFGLFVCCHGRKMIPDVVLDFHVCVNLHPCLFKYKGVDPIGKYMKNKDTVASVGCHFMIGRVDAGEVIHEDFFDTPVIMSYCEFYNIALPYYIICMDHALNVLKEKEYI
jgi:methionyl-tRNA formyltransferase